MFDIDKSHLQLTICPGHLESFGITWRSNKKILYCSDFGERRTQYYTLRVQTASSLHWCVNSCGVAQVYKNKLKKIKLIIIILIILIILIIIIIIMIMIIMIMMIMMIIIT